MSTESDNKTRAAEFRAIAKDGLAERRKEAGRASAWGWHVYHAVNTLDHGPGFATAAAEIIAGALISFRDSELYDERKAVKQAGLEHTEAIALRLQRDLAKAIKRIREPLPE